MTDTRQAKDRSAKWLRWSARAVGSVVSGYWLFIALAYAVSGREPFTVESLIMMGLIIASTVGILIAWWQERIGGIVLLVVAVAHSTFALISSGHNRVFAVLISGGPFLLTGLLFLASWRKGSSQGTASTTIST